MTPPSALRPNVRDLVDLATVTSPGVRAVTRAFLVLAANAAIAVAVAAVSSQSAKDRAEIGLWTVSGPPCQQIAPVPLESLMSGQQASLSFGQAQGAFVHGGAVCSDVDHYRGRQTRPFTVCQFGSPYVVRLDTPRNAVFFQAPLGQPATISFAGGAPHCVLGANFPAALFDH